MNTKNLKVLMDTHNTEWGFFGTTVRNYELSENTVHNVFGKLSHLISREFQISPERARCFLDSKSGRHFSDELSFFGAKKGVTESELVKIAAKVIEEKSWIKREALTQELF